MSGVYWPVRLNAKCLVSRPWWLAVCVMCILYSIDSSDPCFLRNCVVLTLTTSRFKKWLWFGNRDRYLFLLFWFLLARETFCWRTKFSEILKFERTFFCFCLLENFRDPELNCFNTDLQVCDWQFKFSKLCLFQDSDPRFFWGIVPT